jgi:hypothetical protein
MKNIEERALHIVLKTVLTITIYFHTEIDILLKKKSKYLRV